MNKNQRGFVLIEAMVSILIFCLGVLALVAMGTTAVATQSDARFRTDASAMADDIANKISFNVDRGLATGASSTNATILANSLAAFQFQENGTVLTCNFDGSAGNAIVQAWVANVVGAGAGDHRLPGATASNLQITVQPTTTAGDLNRVQITLCWQAPNDLTMRHYTLVTYVN
jgi:type IV pilus assembly protein PilV